MRVLHLAPPLDSGSGLAQYARALDLLLQAEGVEVVRVDQAALGGSAPLNSLADVRAYVAKTKALAPTCDVIHVELGGGALREFYAILSLRRSGIPIAVTAHDPPGGVWYPFLLDIFRRNRRLGLVMRLATIPLARIVDGWGMRQAALIGTTSDAGVASLQRRFPKLKHRIVRFEYPALPLEGTDEARQSRKAGVPLRLAFHGHWLPGKGIETLLEAVARLRDGGIPTYTTLYGGPSPAAGIRWTTGYQQAILQHISSLELEELVRVAGHIPDSELLRTLRQHDAVVLPYLVVPEGHRKFVVSASAAAHDAILAGVPVVCSRARAMDELIQDNVSGSLFDGSVAGLTTSLSRLASEVSYAGVLREGAEQLALSLRSARPAKDLIKHYTQAKQRPLMQSSSPHELTT